MGWKVRLERVLNGRLELLCTMARASHCRSSSVVTAAISRRHEQDAGCSENVGGKIHCSKEQLD